MVHFQKGTSPRGQMSPRKKKKSLKENLLIVKLFFLLFVSLPFSISFLAESTNLFQQKGRGAKGF